MLCYVASKPAVWVDQSIQPGSYCWILGLFTWGGVLTSLRNPQMPWGSGSQEVNGDECRLVQSTLSFVTDRGSSLSLGIFLGEGLLLFSQGSEMRIKRKAYERRVGMPGSHPHSLLPCDRAQVTDSKPQTLHLTNEGNASLSYPTGLGWGPNESKYVKIPGKL